MQLEQLLDSWWDGTERIAWTEFIAYALSRTAFTEKFGLAYGPPGAAKSTLIRMLEHWFGIGNVFTHSGSSFVVSNEPKAKVFDDDGNGHNTTLMSCTDKALVIFPEPSHKAVFKDSRIKTMTGDRQTGRVAHSPTVKSVARTYTPLILCNYLPVPSDPQDTAMRSRAEILTMHRVFYRSEEHKEDLCRKMTPQQQADAKMIKANVSVVEKVLKDPEAATAFLNILAVRWNSLVIKNDRVFRQSDLAKTVAKSYWTSQTVETDSIVAFLKQQVTLTGGNDLIPKKNLWKAYEAWHKWSTQTQGSPGPFEHSEDAFKKRVKAYYGPVSLQDGQRCAHLYSEDSITLPIKLNTQEKQKTRCYFGLALLSCPEAYEI